MRRRTLESIIGAPKELRPVPVSEWDESDVFETDVSDEELNDMFGSMDVHKMKYNGKMSIQHPIDIGGKE